MGSVKDQTTKYLADSYLFNQRLIQAEQGHEHDVLKKPSELKKVLSYSYEKGIIPELFEGDAKEAIETRNPRYAFLVYQTLVDYFKLHEDYLPVYHKK